VHEVRGMCRLDPARRGAQHVDDLATAALDRAPPSQRHAVDERHRDERLGLVLTDVVDGDDVRMSEPSERLRFTLQSLRRSSAVQHLDREIALQLGIVCLVDHAHPAGTEPLADEVAPDLLATGRRPEHRHQRRSTALALARVIGDRRATLEITRGLREIGERLRIRAIHL
jgi:hypothetical protein